MTIEVYQAEFRSLGEKYEIHESTTIHEFVDGQAPGYEKTEEHRVNAYVNGSLVDQSEWRVTVINPADEVHFVLEPEGGAVIPAIVAAVVALAASILLRPSIPNIGGRTSEQGSSIYEVNAQGNKPKLGDVIPEQLGRHKVYPDILTAPVRRWTEDNRSQELCLFMSLGTGYFEEEWDQLKIGSTPVDQLPGISYQAFEPGENVSGNHATQNWYNAPEVGAASGTSGLRLRGTTGGGVNYSGSSRPDGSTLLLNTRAPDSWDAAVRLKIQLFQPVTVGSNQTSIFGEFQHLSDGLPVRIETQNLRGNYRVRSVSAAGLLLEDIDTGVLIDNFPPGEHVIVIDRLDAVYRIVDQTNNNFDVTFQRMLDLTTDDTSWTQFQHSDAFIPTGVYDEGFDPELWTGPFLACPENETTSTIEWDVFLPGGLGYINDNDGIDWIERDVELQWRHLGNTEWNSIFRRVSGNTQDQLGFTFRESIPEGTTPEVRVRRTSIEDTSNRALDEIQWYGLRSWLPTNESYEGITTLAMIVRGSDLIASQTENQINLIQTRRLPTWDGSGWSGMNATRDISAGVRYIAHSVGYTDDDIDMDELIRLHYVWDGRGDTFNYVFDEPTTVKEAENTVLRAGMAVLTTEGGRITPVRDGPRSVPESMYSPQNYIEGGGLQVSVTTPRPDDPDGIDVEYFDENSWTSEIIKCRLPGDNGFRAEKVRLDGVTNPDQVLQIGMRERSRQKYSRWQYSFATPTDALNSKYLSYCVVAGEVPGFAQSAIIEAVSQESDGVHIESSEPLDWNSGVEHVISWRRDDGTYSGAWPAERGDDNYHVIAQIPAGEVPVIQRNMEPPHLLFGEGFHVLVKNIEPDGDSVSVSAENYDERVYAYDDATL